MDKTFDDLFNDFFGNKESSDFSKYQEEAKKLLDNITKSLGDMNLRPFNKEFGDTFDASLGKPDEIIDTNENGLFKRKSIWHTNTGDIVKLEISSKPFDISVESTPILSLEEELKIALENEDYEKAASIRDKMNPPIKKRGRPKKNK